MSEDRLATWRPFVERMRARGWSDERIRERLRASGMTEADATALLANDPVDAHAPADTPAAAPAVDVERLEVACRYVEQARERGTDETEIVEVLRVAGWEQHELAELSRSLDAPLGSPPERIREVIGDAAPPARSNEWNFWRVMRLIPPLLGIAFLAYNAGACLLCALFHRPLMVWGSADGFMVAPPGIDVGAEAVRPGSGIWWLILIIYGTPLLLIFLRAARQVRARQSEREAADRLAAQRPAPRPAPAATPRRSAESATAPELSPEPRRIPLVSPRLVRDAGFGLLCGLLLLGYAMFGDRGERAPEDWQSDIVTGLIYIFCSGMTWLGLRYALSTTIVLDRDAMRLERGKRTLWALARDEVAAWWRELGTQDELRAIVLYSTGGDLRRIKMGWLGWLGLPSTDYEHLLAELKRLPGVVEVPPVHLRDRLSTVHYVLIALLVAIVIAVIFVVATEP